MNRKTFLAIAGKFAAATCAFGGANLLASAVDARAGLEKSSGGKSGVKTTFVAKRQVHKYTGLLSAPPERVFPLLCPVREYEWLEDWRCRMVYSESGVAEDNCVFETNFKDGVVTWVVNHYEPPRRIEFVTFLPGRMTERLNIELRPQGNGTEIHWTRKFTGLSEQGNQDVGHWQSEWDRALTEKLEHFLTNGLMLRKG